MEPRQSRVSCPAAREISYHCPIPSHLSNTNDPPLDQEKPVLRALLIEAEQELQKIDEKMQNTSQQAAEELRHRRGAVERALSVCRGALSPVRRLPREILKTIIEMLELTPWGVTFGNYREIFRTSHVSRIWREASVLCKHWSRIHILSTESNTPPRCANAILDAIFSTNSLLSRPVELSLYIPRNNPTSQRLVDTVVAHSELWRKVSLTYLHVDLFSRFQAAHNRLPVLEEVDLNYWAAHSQDVARKLGPAFQIAPVLHKLAIEYPAYATDLDIPWSQITDFDSGSSPAAWCGIIDIMKRMPKLVRFQGLNSGLGPGDSNDEYLTLHELQCLRLSTLDVGPTTLLDRLILPALSKIVYPAQDQLDQFVALIERSKCQLTNVVFGSFGDAFCSSTDENALVRFFQNVPTINKVTIYPSTDRNICTITDVLHSNCPFAELKEIVLAEPDSDVDSWLRPFQQLLEAVEKRQPEIAVMLCDTDYPLLYQGSSINTADLDKLLTDF